MGQTDQSRQRPGLSEQQKKSVLDLSKPEDLKSLSGDDPLLSMYFDFIFEKKYDPKNRTALSFAFKEFHTALQERETRERRQLDDLKAKTDELFDAEATASPYFTASPQPVLNGLEALLRSPIAAIRNEALPLYSECWRRGTLATNGMDMWLTSALERVAAPDSKTSPVSDICRTAARAIFKRLPELMQDDKEKSGKFFHPDRTHQNCLDAARAAVRSNPDRQIQRLAEKCCQDCVGPRKIGFSELDKKFALELVTLPDRELLTSDRTLSETFFGFLAKKKYDIDDPSAMSGAFGDFKKAMVNRSSAERDQLAALKSVIGDGFKALKPKEKNDFDSGFADSFWDAMDGVEKLIASPIAGVREEALSIYGDLWKQVVSSVSHRTDIWISKGVERAMASDSKSTPVGDIYRSAVLSMLKRLPDIYHEKTLVPYSGNGKLIMMALGEAADKKDQELSSAAEACRLACLKPRAL